ncbi:MAG TPA: aspartate aminotransferase family protein [Candidatus Dormibacteraeota bacterium]|nr:aspartate aminotransferase family protein [Candidatus Dormibacteraeota bacterium]
MAQPTRIFSRNLRKNFPVAVRGEGSWIIASDGRRFLDASGQAAVVTIGHGVQEIGRAMAEQSGQIAFAHTSQFHSEPAEKLAQRLLAIAPPNFQNGGRVYFTSGGSEATETAIKLARQFHLESGQAARYRVLSRRQSYHGSTLGAMSVSGNVGRRAPYQPMIPDWGHIAPCFCYHCPFNKTFPECGIACADDLDVFLNTDPETAAAFIFEPVVGATLGAAPAVEGYAERIAEICRRRGILLIADEVMCGMGRTGKPFAIQHSSVEPDMILVGKGIASGYAPLGAVLVAPRVVEAFERGSAAFMHGFTYQAHPVSAAAGNAVLDYLEAHKLFERVVLAGETLRSALRSALESHKNVGDIRGLGLLQAVEFVKDKSTREPFPKEDNIAEKIRQAALEQNVLTYPTQGCMDGYRGDHVLLAPPFIIKDAECQQIADALATAVTKVFKS